MNQAQFVQPPLCVCRRADIFRLLPGQRAIDPGRVAEIRARIIADPHLLFPPIYCLFDGQYFWIVDGQHRYQGHLAACQAGTHKHLEIVYHQGTEKDAEKAYDLQLLAAPQPPIGPEAKLEEKVSFAAYVQTLINTYGSGFVKTVKVNRPHFNANDLVEAYIASFGLTTVEAFRQTVDHFNTEIGQRLEDRLYVQSLKLSDAHIKKAQSMHVFLGLPKTSFRDLFEQD